MLTLYRYFFASEPSYTVTYCSTAPEGVAMLHRHNYDVLLTDLHLPSMSGLQLTEVVKSIDPGLPVILVTAYPSLDTAVQAIRKSVTDFLSKPITREQLFAALHRAGASSMRKTMRVLAIGAHSEDVQIGAGGTIAQHVAQGDEVTMLALGSGRHGGDLERAEAEARTSADVLGVSLILRDLDDAARQQNGRTIELIEDAVVSVNPDVIYVHSAHEGHPDHRAVHDVTRRATRQVPRVYCYQSPSATIGFKPTRFIAVDDGLSTKLEAVAAFESKASLRDYLAPDMLTATARYWGRYAQATYAEPFEVLRDKVEVNRANA